MSVEETPGRRDSQSDFSHHIALYACFPLPVEPSVNAFIVTTLNGQPVLVHAWNRGDIQCAKMNNKQDLLYLELLTRSVTAFKAALQGPDPDGAELDAPFIDLYQIVLQGQKMNLHGWAEGHPRLGTTFIHTSLLIHISEDRNWARTLSRWYMLGDPQQLDTSDLSPNIDLAGFCTPVGLNGFRIPLHLARRIMEMQPSRFAEIAQERGFSNLAKALSNVAEHWPPVA